MFGIRIIKSATKNELKTADGKVFDLSDKKESSLTAALVIDFLQKRDYFKKD